MAVGLIEELDKIKKEAAVTQFEIHSQDSRKTAIID
jgi:hypothetical protein